MCITYCICVALVQICVALIHTGRTQSVKLEHIIGHETKYMRQNLFCLFS